MRQKPAILFILVVALAVVLAGAAGCSKVNKENFDRISIGMDYDDVLEILGKPDRCDESVLKTRTCIWRSSDREIRIKFLAGKAGLISSKGM